MERHEMTADQALQALAQASVKTDVELRVIAEHLLLGGEVLGR